MQDSPDFLRQTFLPLSPHGIDSTSAEQMLLEWEIMNHLGIITADYEEVKWKILARLA
jgi:hypothetical protein